MRFAKPQPFWLTLIPAVPGDEEAPNGVRAKFSPVTRVMKRKAARAALVAAGGAIGADEELTVEQEDALFAAGEVSTTTMIRLALLAPEVPEWEGVLDVEGEPLPLTEEALDIVLANEEFLDAAEAAYVLPIRLKDAEKNVLPASLNGIGEAGTPGSAIATSSAPLRPGASDATPASTVKTPSRPRRRKGSGTS